MSETPRFEEPHFNGDSAPDPEAGMFSEEDLAAFASQLDSAPTASELHDQTDETTIAIGDQVEDFLKSFEQDK